MAITDPIRRSLARIRNGQIARSMPSELRPIRACACRLLDVLQAEGFIRGYARGRVQGPHSELEIELKYHEGRPVIRELKRVSTPGRRVYLLSAT